MGSHTTGPISYNDDDQFKKQVLAGFSLGDPGPRHEYVNDFTRESDYIANDFVVTEVGVATQTISATEIGGALVLTNAAADNDSSNLQAGIGGSTVAEIWDIDTNKKLWQTYRFKINDATESELLIGLCITDTTALDTPTDGLFFRKSDADLTLQAIAVKGSTETVLDVVEMVDDTYAEVGFYYRNSDKTEVEVYLKTPESEGGDLSKEFAKNSKESYNLIGVLDTNLPDDEALAFTMAVRNGEAVSKVMTIDLAHIAQERN